MVTKKRGKVVKKKRVKIVRRKTVKKKRAKVVKKKVATVKKKIARKVSNNSNTNKTGKKDFEAFKFGIGRLKELERELNSIDKRGFLKQEQNIRKRLKNVSEIPNIESAIKKLRIEINNKHKPKRKRKRPTKDISKGIESIQSSLKRSRHITNQEIIKSNLKNLRNSKKRTEELSKGIESIKSNLRTLKKSRTDSLEDIKEEVKKLRETKKRMPLDSGVDVLVDTNFNEFLNSTKKALSERIKKREQEMDNTLKSDLEKREFNYKNKNDNLLNDFSNRNKKLERDYEAKYNRKVRTTLHDEISKKFNILVKAKLEKEKVELGKAYKIELRKQSQAELEKQKQNLEGKYNNAFLRKLDEEKKKEQKILMSFERDKQNIQKSKQIVVLQKEKDKEDIQKSKQNIVLQKEKSEDEIQKAKRVFVLQKEKERRDLKNKLASEAHVRLDEEISKKEKILRKRLLAEFDLRLKAQVQKHESELKKRKLDLELEMQKKIKQLLS